MPNNPKPTKQQLHYSRSMSFHHDRGFLQPPLPPPAGKQLRRPRTVPNLPSSRAAVPTSSAADGRLKLTKVLMNVTIQGSLGPVQVLMTPESTVRDLVAAAVRQYIKDGRRPVLPTSDPSEFDLHYSQFSLESLDRDEQLLELGSRNFFLCRKMNAAAASESVSPPVNAATSCSKQAEKVTRFGFGLKLMSFLQ